MAKKILNLVTRIGATVILVGSSVVPALSILLAPRPALALTGSGSTADPYVITTCAELQDLNNSNQDNEGDVYILGNDIDCSMTNPSDPDFDDAGPWADGHGFTPIQDFLATLDGRGHTIQGLFEDQTYEAGLFAYAPPLITNLHIDSASHISGNQTTGSFAAHGYTSRLVGVTSAAVLTSNQGPAGGLVGTIYGGSDSNTNVISKSAFTGSVTNTSMDSQVGGLVGRTGGGYDISDSYVNATVAGGYVGGLFGDSGYGGGCNNRVLANSYATGTINTSNSGYSGGLYGIYETQCGSNTMQIIHTFSTMTNGLTGGVPVRGIIGSTSTSVQVADTFFNSDSAGSTDCLEVSTANVPETSTCTAFTDTNYLKNNTTDPPYASESQQFWDFDSIWQTTANYPTLQTVAVQTGPDAPTNLTVVAQPSAVLKVTWDDAESMGSTALRYYHLQVKRSVDTWDSSLVDDTYSTGANDIYIDTWAPSTSIDIRVSTVSYYGASDWLTDTVTTEAVAVHDVSSCADLLAIDDDEDASNIIDTYRLTQDIDCSGVDHFQPIGQDGAGWDGDYFRGIFDGQGHTISGLNIDAGDDYVGLFTGLRGATVSDLNLTSGVVVGDYEAGALAGEADNTSITNVSSDVSVTGNTYVGGLVGYIDVYNHQSATLSRLSSSGDVQGDELVGGIAGSIEVYSGGSVSLSQSSNTAPVTGSYDTGGLSGVVYADYGTIAIDSSFNTGDVSGSNQNGGLIGELDAYTENTATTVTLQNSYNTGNVISTQDNDNETVGGAVGYVDAENDADPGILTTVNIERVYSSGDVVGSQNVGGLIGYTYALWWDFDDASNSVINVDSNFSTSQVTGDEGVSTGGLIGQAQNDAGVDAPILTNNFWDVTRSGQTSCSGSYSIALAECTAVNSADDQADYFKNNNANAPYTVDGDHQWDFNETWGFQTGLNDDLPCLLWQSDCLPSSVTLNSAENGMPISLEQTGCSGVASSSVSKESGLAVQDAAYQYPVGFAGFTLTGCGSSATINLTFTGSFNPSTVTIRKYNSVTHAFTTLTPANSSLSLTTTTLNSQPALQVSYVITDNGPLDQNDTVGAITDPVGIGTNVVGTPNTGLGGSIMIRWLKSSTRTVAALVFAVTFAFQALVPVLAHATDPPRVSITPTPVTLSEGSSQTMTIALDAPIVGPGPGDPYFYMDLTSSDPSRLSVSTPFVSYESSEWSQHKTFQIKAVDDLLVNGNADVTLSFTVSSDSEYYGGFSGTVPITIVDSDLPLAVTSPTAGQSVPEGSLLITGTSAAHQDINVKVDGSSVGIAKASGEGDWSQYVAHVTAGSHSVVADMQATGHLGFLANQYSGSIDVVDVDNHTYVHEITGEQSVGVIYNRHNDTVYSAASWNNGCAVRMINPTTYAIEQSIGIGPDGGSPIGVTLNNGGTKAYLLCQASADNYFVLVIDTATNLPTDQFDLNLDPGVYPSGITVMPDGSQFWVRTTSGIETYDLSDNSHLDSITLGDPGSSYRQNIVFNAAGTRAYTTNQNTGIVSILDTSNNTEIDQIVTGQGANMVALTPDESQLYVSASYPTTAIFIINLSDNTVANTIEINPALPPESLAFTDDGQWVVGDDHGSGGIFFGSILGGATIGDTIFAPNGGSFYTSTDRFTSPKFTRVLGASTTVAFSAVKYTVPNTGFPLVR